jgi:hypothetical protein
LVLTINLFLFLIDEIENTLVESVVRHNVCIVVGHFVLQNT